MGLLGFVFYIGVFQAAKRDESVEGQDMAFLRSRQKYRAKTHNQEGTKQ